jgi:hypothetical protein
MIIFDCVIEILTSKGLMIILNNHNSYASWIGVDGSPQGLWNLPNYSVAVWLNCLEQMAYRYRENPLVVGMDIRNEIHDMDGVYLTWAKSNDITTDWRAASTAAAARLQRANPDMLVIVSGLCFGYDLTEMMATPGPQSALKRRKLVYTAHVYTWDWWWTHLSWGQICTFAAALFLFGAIIVRFQYQALHAVGPRRVLALHAGSALGPFAVAWLSTYVFWHDAVRSLGCSALVTNLHPALAACTLAVAGAAICTARLPLCARTDSRRAWLGCFGALCCLQAVYLLLLALFSTSYLMVERELGRWGLPDRPVPVWVGEFGSGADDDRTIWRHLIRFIQAHELDFAYWPLNGRKWNEAGRRWDDESFGLLTPDYATLRSSPLIDALFRAG